MNDDLLHIGRVKSIDGRRAAVVLSDSGAACGGCAAAFMCRKSEKEDTITVEVSGTMPEVGDRVEVRIGGNAEWAAILYCLVCPLAVLLAVTVAVSLFAGAVAGCVSGLVAVGVYFYTAYFFRTTINKKHRIYLIKMH